MLKWKRSRSCNDSGVMSPPSTPTSPADETSSRLSVSSVSSDKSTSSLASKDRKRRPKQLKVRINDQVSVHRISKSVSVPEIHQDPLSLIEEDDGLSDASSGLGSSVSSEDGSVSSDISFSGSDISNSSADSGLYSPSKDVQLYKKALVKKTSSSRFAKNDKLKSSDKVLPRSRRCSSQLSSCDNGLALQMYRSPAIQSSLREINPDTVQSVTQTTYDITSSLTGSGNTLTLDNIRFQIMSSKPAVRRQITNYGTSFIHFSTGAQHA